MIEELLRDRDTQHADLGEVLDILEREGIETGSSPLSVAVLSSSQGSLSKGG
jgi:hypothetical protein